MGLQFMLAMMLNLLLIVMQNITVGAKEGIMDARMARKGEVFVLNTGSSAYKRVKEQRAIKEGMDIIMCSRCNAKPVKHLDHLFPYHWEMNYCEDCFWGGDYENIR